MASIARYFAQIGISTDVAQLRKVDRYLALVRKKMDAFAVGKRSGVTGRTTGAFTVTPQIKFDNKTAAAQINSQLGHITKNVVLKINQFKVDTASLQRQVRAAVLTAMKPIPVNFTRGRTPSAGIMSPNTSTVGVNRGFQQQPIQRPVSPVVMGAAASTGASVGATAAKQRRTGGQYSYYPTSTRGEFLASTALGAFGGSSMYRLGRLGGTLAVPAIAGMGMAKMANRNQELQMQELTMKSVFMGLAQGGQTQEEAEAEGGKTWQWYNKLADEMGFSYSDNAQDFTGYMANAKGAGVSTEGSQDIYQGLTEYTTAMGVTPYRKKLIYNALNQMFSKGVISQEELKRQMGRHNCPL